MKQYIKPTMSVTAFVTKEEIATSGVWQGEQGKPVYRYQGLDESGTAPVSIYEIESFSANSAQAGLVGTNNSLN